MKVQRSYRLSDISQRHIEYVAKKHGWSNTEVIERAVKFLAGLDATPVDSKMDLSIERLKLIWLDDLGV